MKTTKESGTNLFVYGTLMRGGGLDSQLGDSPNIGRCMVRGRLYDLGSFPGLKLDVLARNDWVYGELYRVTEEVLKRLDVVEGVEAGMYSRRQLVATGFDAYEEEQWSCRRLWLEPALAYVYEGSVVPSQRIPSGPTMKDVDGVGRPVSSWVWWRDYKAGEQFFGDGRPALDIRHSDPEKTRRSMEPIPGWGG
jgi:gamma-glutamylcyclotransferase (GGCT)/AIG2-like uncharacterized protein YtfP